MPVTIALTGVITLGLGPAVPVDARGQVEPSPTAESDVTGPQVGEEQLPAAPEGAAIPGTSAEVPTQQQVADYLAARVHELDEFWTRYFTKVLKLQEPSVSFALITPEKGKYRSDCGNIEIAHDTPNAYYCTADILNPDTGYIGAVYLPVTTMRKMWTGDIFGDQDKRIGDFAAAVLTAHEFGHHIVDELRIQLSNETKTIGPPTGKWKELVADCMAGIWVRSVYESGFLQPGDFEEAVAAMEDIGDEQTAAPDHHGTPQERQQALLTGYLGVPEKYAPGRPLSCIEAYWH
ncbi:neutral zinc metallopeptidase [Streptomyces erythrochromogenes]|uniref:neutral zinc metallopeptidase n=1 Tax=Streptomyces erythrochromogenes TaxID=285574 RepID=UPI003702EDF5